jgi:hypothetical protein
MRQPALPTPFADYLSAMSHWAHARHGGVDSSVSLIILDAFQLLLRDIAVQIAVPLPLGIASDNRNLRHHSARLFSKLASSTTHIIVAASLPSIEPVQFDLQMVHRVGVCHPAKHG